MRGPPDLGAYGGREKMGFCACHSICFKDADTSDVVSVSGHQLHLLFDLTIHTQLTAQTLNDEKRPTAHTTHAVQDFLFFAGGKKQKSTGGKVQKSTGGIPAAYVNRRQL